MSEAAAKPAPVTGDPALDAALAAVADLEGTPLNEQVELLGRANAALAAALSSPPK